MNNDIISQAIVGLINSERFYAELILEFDRFVNYNIPTAAVTIKKNIELHINPNYFQTKTVEERVAILKHECEHITRQHIARFKVLAPDIYDKKKDIADVLISQQKHKGMNIAADLAINGIMANLPEEGVFPKNFDLPIGETMEWYLEQLKDNEKAKDLMNFDDHSLWSESEGDAEMIREKIKQAMNNAAKRTREAGQMTASNELLISELNKDTKNWKNELKRFVAKSIESITESSKKKRNRRYGIMYPGTVKIEELHIGVAIDTSGSVSDEALKQFMSEIHNISKYAKVTVVEADIEVKNSYEYDPKKKYTISGRGGTAYNPALEFFTKNHDIDGLIYFGDMDCFDVEGIIKPKYPLLWAIVGNQNPPVPWGKRILIS